MTEPYLRHVSNVIGPFLDSTIKDFSQCLSWAHTRVNLKASLPISIVFCPLSCCKPSPFATPSQSPRFNLHMFCVRCSVLLFHYLGVITEQVCCSCHTSKAHLFTQFESFTSEYFSTVSNLTNLYCGPPLCFQWSFGKNQ